MTAVRRRDRRTRRRAAAGATPVRQDRGGARSPAGVASWTRDPRAILALILAVAAVLRLIWLAVPSSPFFDESTYVNAARVMLGHQPTVQIWASVTPGLDPNTEHPPLGKLLIAISMAILGDNPVGWRLPSVVASMVTLGGVYGIVRSLGASAWTGVVAVALLALDGLSFVHARMAMLDGMLVAAMVVGAWLTLRRRRVAAGAVFAVATLIKISGVFGLVAAVTWEAWRAMRLDGRAGLRSARSPILALAGAYVAVALVGLWALDLRFTTFTNPLDHVAAMLGFGASFRTGAGAGTIASPYASSPLGWLIGGGIFDYYSHAQVAALVGGPAAAASAPPVVVHAALNPVLSATALAVLVLTCARLLDNDADVERWALIWVVSTYVPWLAIEAATGRVMFLYYLLPAVPGLTIAAAAVVQRLPRALGWVYLAMSAGAFALTFPILGVP
jgi:dolichyl-phosphate-mannose--protein O-mannosyl transferase